MFGIPVSVCLIVEEDQFTVLLKPGIDYTLYNHSFLALNGRVRLSRGNSHDKRGLPMQFVLAICPRHARRKLARQEVQYGLCGQQFPVLLLQGAPALEFVQKQLQFCLIPVFSEVDGLKHLVVGRTAARRCLGTSV